jgi:pimeloyl-ACP methyl ester carboxylesterase
MHIKLILSSLLFSFSLLSNQSESIVISQPDGSEIRGYFHKPQQCAQFPIMIVCQGSYVSQNELQSCKPLFDKIVRNFATEPIGILAIEKRGSYPDVCDLIEFNAYNTVSNRITDNLTTIHALPDIIDGWNGKLILIGGSEGTYVATALAEQLQDQVTALLLIAGAGYQSFKQELITDFKLQPWYARCYIRLFIELPHQPWYKKWFIRMFGNTERQVQRQFHVMQENPTPKLMWAGQTYQYWADAQNRNLLTILELNIPIYYMMGCKDTGFIAGKKLQESACKANRNNITFVWYDHLGHDLGDLFDTVIQDAQEWLSKL